MAVGFASDQVVNSYKPNVPVIPLDQRMEMLSALSCVEIVRRYHSLEYVSGCRELDADIFVVGEDWGAKPHNIVVEANLLANGKKVDQVLCSPRASFSRIRQSTVDQFHTRELPKQAVAKPRFL